jgi:putative Ca2+/H+ antiporter (TMEM165/GDT1 family)
MDLYIAAICFPVIFLGELPDKTMFASLLLATRGRPVQVWLGAAAAFAVHVAIAVTAGVALFALVPHRYLELVVACLFAAAAVYAWIEGTRGGEDLHSKIPKSRHGAMLTAFAVIFVAEWGDLTQVLTANLAARYHAPFAVAVGSLLALWAVAALAIVGGQTLLRFVSIHTIRKVTAVVLLCLAGYTAWAALR